MTWTEKHLRDGETVRHLSKQPTGRRNSWLVLAALGLVMIALRIPFAWPFACIATWAAWALSKAEFSITNQRILVRRNWGIQEVPLSSIVDAYIIYVLIPGGVNSETAQLVIETRSGVRRRNEWDIGIPSGQFVFIGVPQTFLRAALRAAEDQIATGHPGETPATNLTSTTTATSAH